ALLGDERLRRETDGLVRAVAKRLIGRAAASAPVIRLARLDGVRVGPLLGDNRRRHDLPPSTGTCPQGRRWPYSLLGSWATAVGSVRSAMRADLPRRSRR